MIEFSPDLMLFMLLADFMNLVNYSTHKKIIPYDSDNENKDISRNDLTRIRKKK